MKNIMPLPRTAVTALNNGISLDNLHLIYNKYMWAWEDPDGNYAKWEIKTGKKAFLESLTGKKREGRAFVKQEAASCLKSLNARHSGMMKGFESQGRHAGEITLYTESRLIAGLGYNSALQTGITLHHLYGFPFLPGSSVKGLARAAAEYTLEGNADRDALLRSVFGSEHKNEKMSDTPIKGSVTFLDAFPLTFPELEIDILTPHYQPYYENAEGNPPGNWFDPVPVPYLTVAPGTPFRFLLISEDKQGLDNAQKWLLKGLTMLGAGGKTSSGYGFFTADAPGQSDEPKATGDQTTQDRLKTPAKVEVKAKGAEWIAMPHKKKREVKAFAEVVALEDGGKNKVKLLIHDFDDNVYNLTGYKNLAVGDQVNVLVERRKDGSVDLVRWRRP